MKTQEILIDASEVGVFFNSYAEFLNRFEKFLTSKGLSAQLFDGGVIVGDSKPNVKVVYREKVVVKREAPQYLAALRDYDTGILSALNQVPKKPVEEKPVPQPKVKPLTQTDFNKRMLFELSRSNAMQRQIYNRLSALEKPKRLKGGFFHARAY